MHIVQSENNTNVLPQYDAKVFRAALSDGYLDGCTVGASNRNVIIGAGALMMCGRCVIIDSSQVLAAPAGNGYIRVRIDVDSSLTPVSVSLISSSSTTQEDINNGGSIYDVILGTYNSDSATTTAVRTLPQASPRGATIYSGTSAPSSSLGEDGDIYIQY